jgi:iron complex transport system substrate-binding protein
MRTYVISFRLLILLLTCLLLAACGGATTSTTGQQSTPTNPTASASPIVDVYGTPVAIPKTAPRKIVSLAPSVSEILGALNLQRYIVGVDFYTSYPAELTKVQKISDATGKYNIEAIIALKPDLVLSSNRLTQPYDSKLKQLNLNVVDLPANNFAQVLTQIQSIGRLTSTEQAANTLVKQLQQQINDIKAKVAGTTAPSVLLEADNSTPGKPYVFGGGTFGDEILQYANATNIFHSNTTNAGFPQVTDEAIIAANPQYVLLTEDPTYGGKPEDVYKRPNWGNIDAVKNRKVYHINTNIIQHPSQRLVEGLRCVAQIVHPDKFSETLPAYCETSL